MRQNDIWGSRLGFYLVAIGSACGLGNLWRFPFVVSENGGGAFVLIYIFAAFAIGSPLLIQELILGKRKQKPLVSAIETPIPGLVSTLLSLVVLSYYSILSGWVLRLLFEIVQSSGEMQQVELSGGRQFLFSALHVCLAIYVVSRGIRSGLEKWMKFIMPSFAVLMIFLVSKSVNLEATGDAVKYLFYPDFNKLKMGSLNHAIGHVLFTLSLGFGSMVTFGKYLSKDIRVPVAGFRIAFIDTVVSLFAVLLIFPIALSASNIPLTDPALMFKVLPRFILNLPGGVVWAVIFFLSLYFATLSATIGLFENVISNLSAIFKDHIRRIWVCVLSGFLVVLLGSFPMVLGYLISGYDLSVNSNLIEQVDSLMINWLLPLATLFVLYFSRKTLGLQLVEHEFIQGSEVQPSLFFPYWKFLIEWIAPGLILLGLGMQIFGLFI